MPTVAGPVQGTKETDGQAFSLRDQEEGDPASVKGIQEAASG